MVHLLMSIQQQEDTMTGSRSNPANSSNGQTPDQTAGQKSGQTASTEEIAPAKPGSKKLTDTLSDTLAAVAGAAFAIPLLGLRELIGAAQDYHERIPSRRAAWLVKGIEIFGGLLLLLAGWIMFQGVQYIGSHPVPTEPLPALRVDSDAIRSSMFYMLAIGLLAPVTLFLTWASWKFLFNLVDSMLHRYVPRVFRPFAAPLLAVLLACSFWLSKDGLTESFWENYRSFQHNYAQATIDINTRR